MASIAIDNSLVTALVRANDRIPLLVPDGAGGWTQLYMTVAQVFQVLEDAVSLYAPPGRVAFATEVDQQVRSRFKVQTDTRYPRGSTSANIEAALMAFMQHNSQADIGGGGHTIAVLGWNRMYAPTRTAGLIIGVEGKPDIGAGIATLATCFEANLTVTGDKGAQAQLATGLHFTAANPGGAAVPFVNVYGILMDDLSSVTIGGTRCAIRIQDPNMTFMPATGTGANIAQRDVAGNIKTNTTLIATVDTSLDIMQQAVIPAGTLKTNGDRVVIEMWFLTAANANNKLIGIKIGGTANIQSSAVGPTTRSATSGAPWCAPAQRRRPCTWRGSSAR